jgi:molybdopterin biosynthesis enzyme
MSDHYSVDAAIAWLDAVVHSLDREDVLLRTARERVLAKDICAARPIPTSSH